ncbi:MAG TPA: hypothetical protein VGY13_04360 [Solirubrobacteraceae bacterium]|jgi:hypothetical protein|nr:hypothetical protein [Solirubrobacteraceae bacterium]
MLRDDEARLRAAFPRLPEFEAAEWATQSLAVVIHRAGASGWASQQGHDRQRAIVMLAVRQLRASRAGMAVHAVGWEVEARALDRLVIESRARLWQVRLDLTHATGRLWLEGKLKGEIGAAVRASWIGVENDRARSLYRALSQDSHADPGGIMRSLTTVDDDLAAEIQWGPGRTVASRQSLALLAAFAAETATLLADESGVEHPDPKRLAARVDRAVATAGQAAQEAALKRLQ